MSDEVIENEIIIKLELTLNEAQTVLAGLGEIPTKFGLPLVQKIQQQAAPQIPQTAEATGE